MKLRSLVLSALLALGIAPMANAAEEVVPTVSSFDFLVDNSGSMLTSPPVSYTHLTLPTSAYV